MASSRAAGRAAVHVVAAGHPSSCRSASARPIAAAVTTLSERRLARIGIRTAVGLRHDRRRRAPALAADRQHVAGAEREVVIGRLRPGTQENETTPLAGHRSGEGIHVGMATPVGMGDIVHAHPADTPLVERKAAGLDDLEPNAEASGEPERRAEIAGLVRLQKRQPDLTVSGQGCCHGGMPSCVT